MAALQVVEEGDYMFLFDLKSAYLQVKINDNFTQYFSFAAEMEHGRKRFFMYLHMCFGLNDACRVLTKLLRSPLERWRKSGIRCYIHVDDGLCLVKGKERTIEASERVRGDLIKYELLTSEKKSEWGTRRRMTWTGFFWDIVSFKLFVPEDKLERVEGLLEDLWLARNDVVSVHSIAKVAGVIGSFTLAMGNSARFYTRGMLTQVAELSQKSGWESSGKMEDRV